MGRRHTQPRIRPRQFELNTSCELAQGLVFAGIGRHPGTTRYHDSSLHGNTGTLTNGPTWTYGIGRNAVQTVRSGDKYVAIPFTTVASPGSFSFWAMTDGIANNYENVIGDAMGVADYGAFRSATWRFFMRANGAVSSWLGGVHSANVWHSYVFVLTDQWRLYYDGLQQTDDTAGAGAFDIDGFGLGYSSGSGCDASLSDLMIWSRALSQPEIDALKDPSNVMLAVGGNPLLRYRRKWWPVSSGTAATTIRWPWQQRYRRRMAGA